MSIVCIVPDASMADEFRKLSPPSGEKVIVEVGLLYDAVPIARRYEEEADAIVSRGGTVLAMRQAGIATPIVEMQVTAADLARALEKARGLVMRDRYRIGVVAYPNMTQQLRDFLPFFALDISMYELGMEIDTESTMRRALADGMDVLLGGVITTMVARERGVPAVPIDSGETSFRYALEEAARIASARRLRDRRAEELRIITESISEGILAIDEAGAVVGMNKVARTMLSGLPGANDIGRGSTLPAILGDFAGSDREVRKVLQLGSKSVLADSFPVVVGGARASSVITLQETSSIQAMEETIRREIYFKGYVARTRFEDIVAFDPVTRGAVELARRYARTGAAILLRGESGVGKEVFAQGIHNGSPRSSRAFVAMNCAAIPESLFESELFGYVDGAFTGARKKGKPGLFEIAHGGTVFLDEITEMPLALQARLLRVLQEHEVMRLGDDKIIPVDVRIISASNRDIPSLVRSGNFRNDLYWRLDVLNLAIPPLRERRGDIIPLVERMFAEAELCGRSIAVAPDCARFLENHPWPGNIRELKNFCERVTAICDEATLSLDLALSLLEEDMPLEGELRAASMDGRGTWNPSSSDPTSISDRGFDLTLAAVRDAESLGEAARRLGVHRTTLWRRLKRLGAK